MFKKRILRIFNIILGSSLGIAFLPLLWEVSSLSHITWLDSNFMNGLLGGIIFFVLTLIFENRILNCFNKFEEKLNKKSLGDIFINLLGIIIGLCIGSLISIPLFQMHINVIDNLLPASVMSLFAYFGYSLTNKRVEEIRHLFPSHFSLKKGVEHTKKDYKILDTNILIDGRVSGIIKAGFLEGTILIPKFVLYELQYIADSEDSLKRVRGRRGLDILNDLQKDEKQSIEFYEGDFPDIKEVDTKLIYLAKKVHGKIVTNDYNLNKVSEFQNVDVLNINELSNAVKPRLVPGDKLKVTIVKEGTEKRQGVAYLDDGMMIVVEDGMDYLNKTIEVYVTSAIQTAAGRMVFAKPVNDFNR